MSICARLLAGSVHRWPPLFNCTPLPSVHFLTVVVVLSFLWLKGSFGRGQGERGKCGEIKFGELCRIRDLVRLRPLRAVLVLDKRRAEKMNFYGSYEWEGGGIWDERLWFFCGGAITEVPYFNLESYTNEQGFLFINLCNLILKDR